MKVRILLARSSGIAGKIIRMFTWSEWNHVAIEIDGAVFDSTLPRGVGVSSVKQFKESWSDAGYIEIDMPKPERAKEFLMEQRGKQYDWTAIFGFILRRNWAKGNRWFCSELVFCAISEGGIDIPKPYLNKSHRITPRDVELIGQFLKTTNDAQEKIA